MLEPRGRIRGDSAVSDMVGTILLVGLVVLLGSVVAVMVVSSLQEPSAPQASVALARVAPGDSAVQLVYANGEPVALGSLRVGLARGAGDFVNVPPGDWTTPDASMLRAGDTLGVPLSPVLGQNETVRLRVVRSDMNFLLADLSARAGAGDVLLPIPAVEAILVPSTLISDGVTATRLTVKVSHPAGNLAVAKVVADVSAPSLASGSGVRVVELQDDGRNGDVAGGDGVWSGLFALSPSTPRGDHVIRFNVTDAAGRVVANTTAMLRSIPGRIGTGPDGLMLREGMTFEAPTSENITSFRLRDWSWDKLNPARLDGDELLLRVHNGSASWSVWIALEERFDVTYALEMRVWTDQFETIYAPLNGTRLPLAGLDMNLLDPVGSLQWEPKSGALDPLALYQSAGIRGVPILQVVRMGEPSPTTSREIGIVAVTAVMT